jgi:predicted alpha/beta hydrolase
VTIDQEYVQEFVDRGSDRIGLHIYHEPSGARAVTTVVIWPAMGVPARYYRPFAAALRSAGLAVVVADLRGHGSSTPGPSRASSYGHAELVDDVGAVLTDLKPRLNGRKLVLLGHSLGGQLALLHLAQTGTAAVDGVALVAVALPYWRLYPRWHGYVVLPYSQAMAATAALLGVWPGWGLGGRQARGVIRDWAYTARTGRYPMLGGADSEAALREVRTPVLAVSVDDDRLAPPGALDGLCDKLAAAPVRREHYTAAQAGGRLDHFAWVRASAPLAARIAAWSGEL